MLPRLYLRSTGLGQAPETSGAHGGWVLPSTRFCPLRLCPCLALGISAKSHRQTHFSPATKTQETGDSQWRTVLQSPHRGTALCFLLKQIRGEGAVYPPPREGWSSPLKRPRGSLQAEVGRHSQASGPGLPLLSSSGPGGGGGVRGPLGWHVRNEAGDVPLSLSEPCLLRPEV